MLRATTAHTFSISQLPDVVRTWCVLYILTWKRASSHSGVHFVDVSTSKSAPRPSVLNTFDFEMCFAPQRCALFRHVNFQSAPGLVCFAHFVFEMCFSPQRHKFFDILTSKSGQRMVCLVHFDFEMCFAPQCNF